MRRVFGRRPLPASTLAPGRPAAGRPAAGALRLVAQAQVAAGFAAPHSALGLSGRVAAAAAVQRRAVASTARLRAAAAAEQAAAPADGDAAGSGAAEGGAGTAQKVEASQGDPEELTRKQLKQLFRDLPTNSGLVFCYLLHTTASISPKVWPPLPEKRFEEIFTEERGRHQFSRRFDVMRRRSKRRNYNQLNAGYTEPEEMPEAEEPEFTQEWRTRSIAEDVWKAEWYQGFHRNVHGRRVPAASGAAIPESEPLAFRSDRISDVFADSLRKHVLDQNRPVLTHELADFENPYMMKRSALERLLQELCSRNQLDERLLPRLLDRHPELVKLRAEAALPPEALEPLAAFRGDARWSFDARERLAQKLDGARAALDALGGGASPEDVAASLPENAPADADQVGDGIRHPWRNHLGFETAVPQGVAGGQRFGQPRPILEEQAAKTRYPTLQRVAHTLPSDPKYRAHVVRTIRVLERSKDWDFKSKLKAINTMKEVYDQMRPSAEYTAKLDKYLPLNRVPSHLKRKYARDQQYVKTFRKRFLLGKSFTRYRPSLTATAPMKISDAKKKFNVGR